MSTSAPGAPRQEYESAHVDFLTATHRDREFLLSLLAPSAEPCNSYFGFGTSFKDHRDVVVAWDHPLSSAARISIGGAALEQLRWEGLEREVLTRLGAAGARVTRVDLARDTGGSLTPRFLERADRAGKVWTRYDRLKPHGRTSDDDLNLTGGSRGSNSRLNVYAKDVERRDAGKKAPGEPRTRWELSLGPDTAPAVFADIVALDEQVNTAPGEVPWPLLPIVNRELAKRVRIYTSPEQLARGRRGRLAPYWSQFVSAAAPSRPARPLRDHDPADAFGNEVRWLLTAAGPVLYRVLQVVGPEAIQACAAVSEGRGNLVSRQFVATEPARAAAIFRDLQAEFLRARNGGGR